MDLHKIVMDELKRQGRSKYWLAESPGCGINQNTVYAYLRGDGDTTGRTLGAMMEALRLQVVPDPDVPTAEPKPRRGRTAGKRKR